jgi:DICT domain-containing protein
VTSPTASTVVSEALSGRDCDPDLASRAVAVDPLAAARPIRPAPVAGPGAEDASTAVHRRRLRPADQQAVPSVQEEVNIMSTPRPGLPATDLTIGAVAARTGASVARLRAWERRYGFPRPRRDDAGRRVFDDATCAQIIEVLARRDSGQSVRAAIDAVREPRPRRASVFATVRDAAPHLDPRVLGVAAMRALSHAVEDACLARPADGMLLGAFQRAASFERAHARWRALAGSVGTVVAFADFAQPEPDARPARIPFEPRSPLQHEWAVVCHSRELTACLAGWERPPAGPGPRARRFEAVWTTETAVVTAAAVALGDVVARVAPSLAARLRAELERPTTPSTRIVDDVTARAVSSLELRH